MTDEEIKKQKEEALAIIEKIKDLQLLIKSADVAMLEATGATIKTNE